ncbi:Fic family protein [Daejeonella lutea]|uniref:Fic family protein n=1 Tax=Daejeonella lutea TaxID=572036 RepID=A0A1T5B1I0_9SPHI|nr:Fic family protein [Daejeonella lutea]SKB41108.1 Fic family protein [Daejeonella lutea]
MTYNWEQETWPDFTYDLAEIEQKLYLFSEKTGTVSGVLKSLPEDTQLSAIIDTMVAEAIKTSAIEGEFLDRNDVVSSIRNNLGLNEHPDPVPDKRAKGIGQLMVDVRNTFSIPLDQETLFSWHRMLLGNDRRINAGQWRASAEPMQVVSGTYGKEQIHFEAPPSDRVPKEMERFINWFNETTPGGKYQIIQAPVRSAIAHLYFETIHPFEDGNGRIGRAISEKAISQGIGRPALLALSKIIEANKAAYYEALKTAQRSNEITAWIAWFVEMVIAAQTDAEQQIEFALRKTKFFDKFKDHLSERQLKVIRRMLEEGPEGFQGGMNARKYGSITQVSKATATRDLQDLVEQGIFVAVAGMSGRSTSYEIYLGRL